MKQMKRRDGPGGGAPAGEWSGSGGLVAGSRGAERCRATETGPRVEACGLKPAGRGETFLEAALPGQAAVAEAGVGAGVVAYPHTLGRESSPACTYHAAMFERIFEKTSRIPGPSAEVFDWHTRGGAFARLTPPWDKTQLIEDGGIRDGDRVVLRVWAPWPREWVAEHEDYIAGIQFKDRQVEGPFPKWVHTHRVYPDPDGKRDACLMRDHIEFKLPKGPLGAIAYRLFMRKKIQKMFDHRHRVLAADIADHRLVARGRRLTVAMTGASGMIGTALAAYLRTGGHTVYPVARRDGLTFDLEPVRGADVLIHLAGEPIAQRWDADVKNRIRHSRVDRTRVLCEQLERLPTDERPRTLLSGSAVGFYGDREDDVLTEHSTPGDNFLADVAKDWETATKVAQDIGIRVVHLRTGIVLHPKGGALDKMLTPFKFGGGGRLGGGEQYMSWITLDDHIRAIYHVMFDDTVSGAVNLVAPDPVTNRRFTKTLAKVLRRPALIPAPRFALRRMFGEMADEALLSSQRVEPVALERAGFAFRHPELESALRGLLGR